MRVWGMLIAGWEMVDVHDWRKGVFIGCGGVKRECLLDESEVCEW